MTTHGRLRLLALRDQNDAAGEDMARQRGRFTELAGREARARRLSLSAIPDARGNRRHDGSRAAPRTGSDGLNHRQDSAGFTVRSATDRRPTSRWWSRHHNVRLNFTGRRRAIVTRHYWNGIFYNALPSSLAIVRRDLDEPAIQRRTDIKHIGTR